MCGREGRGGVGKAWVRRNKVHNICIYSQTTAWLTGSSNRAPCTRPGARVFPKHYAAAL